MDLGLIITWSLVERPAGFVNVGNSESIMLARASLSHRSPRCPGRAIFSSPAVFKREAHIWSRSVPDTKPAAVNCSCFITCQLLLLVQRYSSPSDNVYVRLIAPVTSIRPLSDIIGAHIWT